MNTVSQGFSPEEVIFTLSAWTHQDDLKHHSEIVSLTKVFSRMSASTVYQKADGSRHRGASQNKAVEELSQFVKLGLPPQAKSVGEAWSLAVRRCCITKKGFEGAESIGEACSLAI